jgi:AbrB family looped-hinge helix DNA binding protein
MVVVIPKELREKLKIKAGYELLVRIEGSKIIYSKTRPGGSTI